MQKSAKAKIVVMVGPGMPEAVLKCMVEGEGDTDVVLPVDDVERLGLPPTDVEIPLPPFPPLPPALAILLLLSPPFPLPPLALVVVLLPAVTASAVLERDVPVPESDRLGGLAPLESPSAEEIDPLLSDPPGVLVGDGVLVGEAVLAEPSLAVGDVFELALAVGDVFELALAVGDVFILALAVGDVFELALAKEADELESEPNARPALELEDVVDVGAN